MTYTIHAPEKVARIHEVYAMRKGRPGGFIEGTVTMIEVARETGIHICTVLRIAKNRAEPAQRGRLTADQVRAARELMKVRAGNTHRAKKGQKSITALAAEYGVSPGTLRFAAHGFTYKWVQ